MDKNVLVRGCARQNSETCVEYFSECFKYFSGFFKWSEDIFLGFTSICPSSGVPEYFSDLCVFFRVCPDFPVIFFRIRVFVQIFIAKWSEDFEAA